MLQLLIFVSFISWTKHLRANSLSFSAYGPTAKEGRLYYQHNLSIRIGMYMYFIQLYVLNGKHKNEIQLVWTDLIETWVMGLWAISCQESTVHIVHSTPCHESIVHAVHTTPCHESTVHLYMLFTLHLARNIGPKITVAMRLMNSLVSTSSWSVHLFKYWHTCIHP